MEYNRNVWQRRLAALAVLGLLGPVGGCALGLEHVDIAYLPANQAQPIAGAERVPVDISVRTATSVEDERVGAKKNGYGIELGGLAPTRPVTQIVGDALAIELRRRGFPVQRSTTVTSIEVIRFWNDFKNGFFVAGTEADVTLAITVRTPTALLYSRTVSGRGGSDAVIVGTAGVAREALQGALTVAVSRIVDDPAYIAALFAAAR